MDIGCTCRS